MVGITLSPEQIRSAPAEVRRWLEGQIAISLGLRAPASDEMPRDQGLISLSLPEAADVFVLIEKIVPAVQVFFEFGRVGESIGEDRVEAYSLTEMMRHARLETMEQLLACLQTINDAARYVRREAEGRVCHFDRRGYCLVAAETQKNIFRLWNQIITQQHDSVAAREAGSQGQSAPSLHVSGAIPPAALHMTVLGSPAAGPQAQTEGAMNMERGAPL